MSLSDDKKAWGAIHFGTTTVTLAELEAGKEYNWTEADEAAYLQRVREKAAEMAAALIEEARQEADSVREAARQEGYAAGLAQVEKEIEEFQSTVGESVSGVLTAIEGQCSAIFAEWRQDLVDLLRLSAQKILGLALTDDKARILEALYLESVAALENRRSLVVRVNPEDEPAIADIIAMTQARFPDLTSWSVKGDPQVEAGGLVVESEDSLADNRLERRAALVTEILGSLSLPPK